MERNVGLRRHTKKHPETEDTTREKGHFSRHSSPNLNMNKKSDFRAECQKPKVGILNKKIKCDAESDDKYVSGRLDIKIGPAVLIHTTSLQKNSVLLESLVAKNDTDEKSNKVGDYIATDPESELVPVNIPNMIKINADPFTTDALNASITAIAKNLFARNNDESSGAPNDCNDSAETASSILAVHEEFDPSDLTPGNIYD